jgi:2-polyprenyl-3-methyl-5-hydroxy-6-metoxy-1,4-benzoquinol methylase
MRFAFHCGRRLPQFDFFLGIKTKSEQFRARNAIVDEAMKMGADWLLMLDDDMVINPCVTSGPADAYGFIERLIAHDKDICGVLYYQRTGTCSPVLMAKMGDADGYRFLRDDEVTGGLQRVDIVGGGCLLIKMRVFDRILQPYFEPEFKYGTDIQLCRKAASRGLEVWADTGIEFGHVRQERVIVTSRNRGQIQLEHIPGEAKAKVITADVYNRLFEDAAEWTGFHTMDEMSEAAASFLNTRSLHKVPDADWYRTYGKERVARQVWFNSTWPHKRQMTDFILGVVNGRNPLNILDFGCGIGITAFTLAERGHKVTALDIGGTGTLDFLKWRCAKHGVNLTVHESRGGVPHLGGAKYDVIIAMDSIEHVSEWRTVVRELGDHLVPQGTLFSNNAILEDDSHPEHYHIDHREFIAACMKVDLMPFNQITYIKKVEAGVAPNVAEPALAG